MPIKGIGGLAFGGPNRDIPFVITVHSYVQVLLAQVTETIDVPSSLFIITGLGASAHGSSKSNSLERCVAIIYNNYIIN